MNKLFWIKLIFWVLLISCEEDLPFPLVDVPDTSDWVTEKVTASMVDYRKFYSEEAKREVSFHIFLPPAYQVQSEQSFPVMFWLHGSGEGLSGIPILSNFYGQAMARGDIPPFIIVFPYGFPNGMWSNSKDGKYPVEDMLINDLIPFVDANFRTNAGRTQRIIEGFSMGGHGAARLGFKFPELFTAASLMGAGPLHLDFIERGPVAPAKRREVFAMTYGNDQVYYEEQHPRTWASRNAERIIDKLHVRQAIGTLDALHPFNVEFREFLHQTGVAPDYVEAPGVGHETLPLMRALGESHWAFYRTLWP
jgi:enterochelin esterase-like enzyme